MHKNVLRTVTNAEGLVPTKLLAPGYGQLCSTCQQWSITVGKDSFSKICVQGAGDTACLLCIMQC
jgi:hypothetical protein